MKVSFNVAASIKMRKFYLRCQVFFNFFLLQCGRIYKDAEIRNGDEDEAPNPTQLQCGRIYKDAEINNNHISGL